MDYSIPTPSTSYDANDSMAVANAAQRRMFAAAPVLPNYGEVPAGQAYAKPAASAVPQVLGAQRPMTPMEASMAAANAAQRARNAANPVVPNASPQTDWVGHLGNMLGKIFGGF